MNIIYTGPSAVVNVHPYGPQNKGEEKDYPDGFGVELLATSKKQRFKEVQPPPPEKSKGNTKTSDKKKPGADLPVAPDPPAETDPPGETEPPPKEDPPKKPEPKAEPPPAPKVETDPDADLIAAAKVVIEAGEVTGEGKPHVKAMEKILGCNINAADRDRAWEKLRAAKE